MMLKLGDARDLKWVDGGVENVLFLFPFSCYRPFHVRLCGEMSVGDDVGGA